MDAKARRLLVSQAPLDRVPASAFLPALTGVLGPGVVLSQRISPDVSAAAAEAAARCIAQSSATMPIRAWRWPLAAADAWRARLHALTPALGGDPALYFSVRWGTLGALRAAPAMILPHALALATQSLGCLLTSASGTDGLRLDFLEGEGAAHGAGRYELIVWGERWGRAAIDALESAPTH
jgi:hypothetical protein